VIPVLVTRNASSDGFIVSGEFKGNETKTIGIGAANGGESDTPFGNKAFIVIRKGGGASVIKAKYAKQYLVYNRQGFTIPTGTTCQYLKTGAK